MALAVTREQGAQPESQVQASAISRVESRSTDWSAAGSSLSIWWTRPLFGAVNLVTGLAASVVGLAMVPVDGGETLWPGLRGALFSLPELVFQNIRKGSFEPPASQTPQASEQ